MKIQENNQCADKLALDMFYKTGNIGYYMLAKKISNAE